MKVAAFQFSASASISDNHKAIKRAIEKAAHNKVRLLVFQECATCGYPPVEIEAIEKINFEILSSYLEEIKDLANRYNMYIALGTIRKENGKYYNSIQLINPRGQLIGTYDKRALWGWDMENFAPGQGLGVFKIDNIKVGFRICFEVRFPEYFRELFKEQVDLCFVSFCDVLKEDSIERYNRIKAHLITRAMENVITVISVNSTSYYQTAPTAVIDINGNILYEAPRNQEYLIIYDYQKPVIEFGEKGRLFYSNKLLDR